MKNIKVFPDTHGRFWSLEDDSDQYVFLGDYFDSFNIPFSEQLFNFQRIIQFKKEMGVKCFLLLGNHDVQYFDDRACRCSGFQTENYSLIRNCFLENKELFKYTYSYKNYMFTHGGVNKTWIDYVIDKYSIDFNWSANVADQISDIVNYDFKEVHFISPINGGYDMCDGPLWYRPNFKHNQKFGIVDGITQVVGHTFDKLIRISSNYQVIDSGRPVIYNI
jgi:UDP-2,3-diacylglucosamine pyrophosphatase LpxH